MMPEPLTLVCPSAGPRLRDVIETALCDLPVRNAQGDLRGARILFALDAGSAGMDEMLHRRENINAEFKVSIPHR